MESPDWQARAKQRNPIGYILKKRREGEMSTFKLFFGIGALLLSACTPALCSTSTVSTVTELENALALALTNREDDVINVEPGIYYLYSTLNYQASTNENKALTLQCPGGGAVIDAGSIEEGSMRGLYIKTSGTVSHVTLSGLTIRNARLYNLEGSGAALFAWVMRGSLTLQNCVIRNNTANQFLGSPIDTAGAWLRIDNTPGVLTVRDCVFSNNYATGAAGGLYMSIGGGATGHLFNCLFTSNNAASRGGGAYVNVVGGSVFVENNTFISNWTGNGVSGGGGLSLRVYLDSDSATVRNNIIWGNTSNTGLGSDLHAEDDPDGNSTGSLISVFNNDCGDFDIQDGDHLTQGSNTNTDPLLTSDYHLRAASRCIDTGSNLAWMAGAGDMDGQGRIFNGCADMGIDEATVAGTGVSSPTTTVWDTVVDAKCQIQFCTNLLSGQWQQLGSTATATSRRIILADTNTPDSGRAYSLKWQRP